MLPDFYALLGSAATAPPPSLTAAIGPSTTQTGSQVFNTGGNPNAEAVFGGSSLLSTGGAPTTAAGEVIRGLTPIVIFLGGGILLYKLISGRRR